MRPPASLRIGPHRWTVRREPFDVDGETFGRTLEAQLTILIAPGSAPSQERETVLHEILHACLHTSGMNSDSGDAERQERTVGALAPVLLGVLLDNRRLLTYLLDRATV